MYSPSISEGGASRAPRPARHRWASDARCVRWSACYGLTAIDGLGHTLQNAPAVGVAARPRAPEGIQAFSVNDGTASRASTTLYTYMSRCTWVPTFPRAHSRRVARAHARLHPTRVSVKVVGKGRDLASGIWETLFLPPPVCRVATHFKSLACFTFHFSPLSPFPPEIWERCSLARRKMG